MMTLKYWQTIFKSYGWKAGQAVLCSVPSLTVITALLSLSGAGVKPYGNGRQRLISQTSPRILFVTSG